MNKKRLMLIIAIFISIIVVAVFIIKGFYKQKDNIEVQNEETKIIEPVYKYGIYLDKYDIIEDVIAPNENLSDLLIDFEVTPAIINKVATAATGVCDVRKIRSGNSYRLLVSKDSLQELHYLVYDISSIEYAVFCFKDSAIVYRGVLPTDTICERVTGTINTSLWNAMLEGGTSPEMAMKLSDIYQWSIDFFSIDKGDKFDMIYEEIYVDNELVSYGNILASSFTNKGKTFKAYRFDVDGVKRYFDEEGESLKSQFLKAPLKYKRISSGFSHARRHPITKKVRPHHGVDYAAPAGTPVYAIGNGVIINKGWDNRGGGNYIKIKHNRTYTTLYMHLKGFAKGLSVGTRVSQGQLIGYVGSTGMSTGPHLDFRIYKNGTAINPLKMERVPSEPMPEELKNDFFELVEKYEQIFSKDL